MRRFILSSLELFSQVAIFLILVSGLINGAISGGVGGTTGAIAGGIIGFLAALVVCVILFGAIFLLIDISANVRRTADALDVIRQQRSD